MSRFRIPWDRPAIWWLAVLAVAAPLILLAWLQYRWIGDLSQAERERMQAGLRSSALRMAQDFNGEIGRLMRSLQLWRPMAGPAPPEEHARSFFEWAMSSPHRRLVLHLYLSGGGESGAAEVALLNPESGQFEPAGWPENLAAVKKLLEARAGAGFGPAMPPFSDPLELDLPVLAAPRIEMAPPPWRPRGGGPMAGPPRAAGWVVAELDANYIRNQYLPELAHRHFGADFVLDVVSRADPGAIIYSSDPSQDPITTPDIVVPMFELGPEQFGFRQGRGGRGKGPPGPPPVEERGRWLLRVEHRAGSLEAAVAQLRRRNLAVSLGIVLLLAASVAMLVTAARRAQRLARLQMEFVAGVSHELRTPLTVIRSAGDNLADGLVAGQEQARRYGTVIRDEGRRLSDMVEQILRFAGIQSGRARYEFQPVDIPEIVERAVADCEAAIRKSGCRVERDIDLALPPVMADPTSLTHCLSNLIGNALKYGQDGGWVGIDARGAQRKGQEVVEIRVRDRGQGVEPGELPHIFEPFYRGRRATASQTPGAGIGLALVQRIVEAHQGTVEAGSDPNTGTWFTVRLPAATEGNPLWEKEFS